MTNKINNLWHVVEVHDVFSNFIVHSFSNKQDAQDFFTEHYGESKTGIIYYGNIAHVQIVDGNQQTYKRCDGLQEELSITIINERLLS